MDEVQELIKKAEELFEKEQYKEIIALLPDELLEKHNNDDLYAWRARAHNVLTESDNALEYANKAIMVNPNSFFGYRVRGVAWDNKGEYDKAITDYNKAIELKKDYSEAYSNRGVTWFNKGEYDKAISDYDKSIELKKDFANAYINRGVTWENKGEYDKAIADYDKAIEFKKDYANAYNNRGSLLLDKKGEFDKAIDDFDKAIEFKKNYAEAYYNRGNAWVHKIDFAKAIVNYDKAIELKKDFVEAYHNRSALWDKIGEYDKAIDDLNKVVELKKDNAITYYNRGRLWNRKGIYDKAIDDYNKAIDIKKNYAEAYNNRGVTWENKGEYDKAISDFDNAIVLKPDLAHPLINRGRVFFIKGDFQKAIEDYERAGKLDNKTLNTDYYIKLAKEKIEEARNLEVSKAKPTDKEERIKIEKEIEKAINTIRKAARSEVKTVVHYTKVFVADIYVKNIGAKMHYSNAIYMNDPMEGQMIFEYLNDKEIEEAFRFGEKRTETSVYLGSFLPAEEKDGDVSHEDELVMWRTYGKDENGKEAAGCSVVLNSDFFKTRSASKEVASEKEVSKEELLNVVYIKTQKNKKEIIDVLKGEIKVAMDKLKKLLLKLIKLRKKYEHDKKGDFYKDIEGIIFKQLSTISYLFKSADYQFEREVRVITYMPRDSDLIKSRENKETNAPCKRFYIESENDILPYIKQIFLGPKVENYQQWSLYFDYEVRQRAKELEAMASPPYRIKPSDIEIMKSGCKFQ